MSATKTKTRRAGRKAGTWIDGLDSKRLASWREETRTSRHRLASYLGVSSTSIQNWETGTVPVHQTQLQLAELMKSVPTAEKAAQHFTANLKRNGNGASNDQHSPKNIEIAIVDATAQIVASLLASSKCAVDDVPGIIAAVRKALTN